MWNKMLRFDERGTMRWKIGFFSFIIWAATFRRKFGFAKGLSLLSFSFSRDEGNPLFWAAAFGRKSGFVSGSRLELTVGTEQKPPFHNIDYYRSLSLKGETKCWDRMTNSKSVATDYTLSES
jgi:hypothetical protein